jgi:flagellar biosynthesis protein FliQ
MTDATVIDIMHRALLLAIMVSAPVLVTGLLVGIVVSVFQAATQIHEMSLTFIPKMVAVAVAVVLCGPWMLMQIIAFTSGLLQSIPTLVK